MPTVRTIYEWLGRMGVAFFVLLIGSIIAGRVAPQGASVSILRIAMIFAGAWVAVRLLWRAARHATWRLRNRLLVTYLFMAVVPILLIAALAVGGGLLLAWQLAVYLETSELDRRVENLVSASDSILRTPPEARSALIERMIELFYRQRYPGIEVLVRDGKQTLRYPNDATLADPKPGWNSTHGVLAKDRRFYLWSYEKLPAGDITITVPLTPEYLEGLVPDLGEIDFGESVTNRARSGAVPAKVGKVPDPANQFDLEYQWSAVIPTSNWEEPGKEAQGFLKISSRVSALLNAVFNRKDATVQGVLQTGLEIGVVVFFIVEIISFIIGISMTRTITGAVHRLYEGTQKVIEGDFSHRIEVQGADQLAELGKSFNSMTENLERLLVVAKEKERLQSEIEIAREVQNQLYPRVAPKTGNLNVTAICQPARMVSGDYYDYELIRDTQVALAIGDVAGKGISAALLMATLQSSLRTQLQNWMEIAAAVGNGAVTVPVSTSRLMGRLNNQLHAYTSPEKYATFLFGVYDEPSGSFTYTNAGHLPPLVVHNGVGTRLDVNGTVVGAFAFSHYGESRVELGKGDLLVCFTDGVTEPENEYGEMFGEDRLTDLIVRNAHRDEQEIIDLVIKSVRQWTSSEELQDDMTMLLARRV